MADSTPPRPSRRDAGREDRLEILRLVETGDVTADEAAGLLDALDQADRRARTPEGDPPPRPDARQLRIRVTESVTGLNTVNLAVPLGLIDAGLDIARRFVPEHLPPAAALSESIGAGFRGVLLEVDDGDERVQIVVE